MRDGGDGGQGDYTLDVDPAGVRSAASRLETVHQTLESAHTSLSGLTGQVDGVIRGAVATSFVTTYGSSLGELSAVVGKVEEAVAALKTLAAAYDHGKNTVLPKINTQLHAAQTTLNTAVNRAGDAYSTAVNATHPDENAAMTALTAADSRANGAYETDVAGLDKQYQALVTELQQASTTASGKLQELTEGTSLYEAADALNTKIGYGLSPATLGLAGPEIKALKELLSIHNAYSSAAKGMDGAIADNVSAILQIANDQDLDQATTARLLAQDQANIESEVAKLGKQYESWLERAGRGGGLPEEEAAQEASVLSKLAGPLDLLAKGTAGIGMLSDVLTVINPGAGGAEGWVNRGMSIGNFVGTPMVFSKKYLDKLGGDEAAAEKAASEAGDAGADTAADGGLDAAVDSGAEIATEAGGEVAASELAALGATAAIPVAGQVIVVGTGLYLVGDWAYNNVGWFHTGVDDTGHGIADAGKWVGHQASDAYNGFFHGLESMGDL